MRFVWMSYSRSTAFLICFLLARTSVMNTCGEPNVEQPLVCLARIKREIQESLKAKQVRVCVGMGIQLQRPAPVRWRATAQL